MEENNIILKFIEDTLKGLETIQSEVGENHQETLVDAQVILQAIHAVLGERKEYQKYV